MGSIDKTNNEMIQYFWNTMKPLIITFSAWLYAFLNTKVLVFFQAMSPAEQYPEFNLIMFFVIKITGAISGIFGAFYIIYRFIVFHRKHKK